MKSNIFSNAKSIFKVEKGIASRVYFWENVFLKYSSNTHVIHDLKEPWIVVDVIPYEKLSKDKKSDSLLNRENQKKMTEKYLERYRLALKRFAQKGKKATSYGAMERRIHTVYKQSLSSLQRLYSGKVAIRYQQGLSDTFVTAAKRAQDFLPYIEREFRNHGVPIEVTRLAFVESMFNSKAVSKVGASGMWQFMRSTGKSYMKINSKIDERNSPLKAARAAAKLLRGNYQSLGSWPLAITAYNHGRAGMNRAVKKSRSKDLSKIIKRYKKKSFGFASQNFYAEFLAALRSYNYLIKKNIINVTPSSLDIVSVNLKKPLRIRELSSRLRVPISEIKKHNSCIKGDTYSKYNSYRLPKNYELFIPRKYTRNLNYTVATLRSKKSRG
jgi:membrane-bound lytic murein transglycosylase D